MTDQPAQGGRRGANRVTVLAHKMAIGKMLGEGHSLACIYDALPGLGSMSYSVFTHHVRKYIRPASDWNMLPLAGPLSAPDNGQGRAPMDTAPAGRPARGKKPILDTARHLSADRRPGQHHIPPRKPVLEYDPDSARRRRDLI